MPLTAHTSLHGINTGVKLYILDVWNGSQFASGYEYAKCQCYKYVRVTQGSEYAIICLNNYLICLIITEFV